MLGDPEWSCVAVWSWPGQCPSVLAVFTVMSLVPGDPETMYASWPQCPHLAPPLSMCLHVSLCLLNSGLDTHSFIFYSIDK